MSLADLASRRAARVEEERRRDAVVVAAARGAAGVLLERLDVEARRARARSRPGRSARACPDRPDRGSSRCCQRRNPSTQSATGWSSKTSSSPARAALRRSRRPAVEVVEPVEHAFARVDEVEAAAAELARQRLRVAVDPEDLRPPLARRLERARPRVDAGRHGAQLGERGGRLARPAVEMEHALALQVAEGALHDRRQHAGLGSRSVASSNARMFSSVGSIATTRRASSRRRR